MNALASNTWANPHENGANLGLQFSWTDTTLWKKAVKHVNRIQVRIAKAVKQGKKNLVNSYSAPQARNSIISHTLHAFLQDM